MSYSSIFYKLPNKDVIEFTPEALEYLESHKQKGWFSKEAGGQLFSEILGTNFKIVDVTGPRSTDKRSKYCYIPDREAERIEIKEQYAKGFHYIGDWHTHFQKVPIPSDRDEQSMKEMVAASNYDLDGFLMVIVGQEMFPSGLHVSFYSKSSISELEPYS